MRLRLIPLLFLASAALAQGWQEKSSPFQAVRWRKEKPIVRFEGDWWELVSLHGKSAKAVVSFCKKRYEDRWQKRVVEDLGEVLNAMGVPSAPKVKLVLKGVFVKERKEVEAPMTWDLRRQAKRAGNDLPFVLVNRTWGDGAAFGELAGRVRPDFQSRGKLTAAEAASDLSELEGLMEGCYSYLTRRNVDYRAALDAIRAGLGTEIPKATFALQLRKFFALFGDGHTDVEGSLGRMGGRLYAPWLFGIEKGRIFVFREDRGGFWDDAHPFVASIDETPIRKWYETAKAVVPRGSKRFVEREAVRNLRYISYLRQELGLRHRQFMRVVLSDGEGNETGLKVDLTGQRPRYGEWPRTKSRILPGNIGYLRIARMSGEGRFLDGLEKWMAAARETKGLIIDVRGNGGGSRAALRVLAPYFMTDKEPPRVANVAAYRLPPWEGKERREGHLDNRWLYPLTWPGWSKAAKGSIQAHLPKFKPEWKLPKKKFTSWHFMVLDRSGAKEPYVYREQVIVLMDGGCFSATDVFLGAFKGWPGFLLLGTPSGGGSGRARGLGLAASGLSVSLSSMASFRPDGKLYDGRGVQPDVVVEQPKEFWVGKADRQLEEGARRLK